MKMPENELIPLMETLRKKATPVDPEEKFAPLAGNISKFIKIYWTFARRFRLQKKNSKKSEMRDAAAMKILSYFIIIKGE